MNKLWWILLPLMVILTTSCSNNKKVVIEIPELDTAMVYIAYADPDMINARTQEEIAKTEIINGKCEIILDSINFDGKRKECTVTIVNQEMEFGANFPLPIEKGKTITLKITGIDDYLAQKSTLNPSYSGSKFAEDFSEFWKQVNSSFADLSKNGNSIKTYEKQVQLYKDFIKKYPESCYAYSAIISEMLLIQDNDNPIMKYCSQLSEEKSDNVWHNYLVAAYKDKQLRQTTASTLVFSAKNINGDVITERDIKGKLILIDFWASWCKPCIESLPKLEKIYAKYKNKGLTVVSISLDMNPNDWLAYMNKNSFKWTSLLGDGQELTQRYDFQYIPFVLIANQDGKILQKGIEVDKLENFIEDYLNK